MKTPNGETVIDYGQNLAGYIEFTLYAHAGDRIVLTHGETLDENGNFTQENFQDRKRHKEGGTRQQVVYTCKEGKNHYKSRFTIWGFRYAKVETDIDISGAAFTSIAVYSRMEQTGSFECSDRYVNRLVQNSIWSQKSNFCDVPTDCPTRERAAWTGDMGVFAETGLYLMDCYPVIRKWLAECRMAQFPDGKIANIAPKSNVPGFFAGLLAGSVGWGDACIIVPYALYKRFGDRRILEENYEMMQKWYGFLENRAKQKPLNPIKRLKRNPYRRFTIETGVDYGEWCEPDVESTSAMRTPQGKVATAWFARSGKMLAENARKAWTGWDYIGEAGVGIPAYQLGEGGFGAQFPCQLAYCGDIDITGFRRPASYYREAVFGRRENPYLAIQNPYKHGKKLIKTPWVISDSLASWTYPGQEGRMVTAEVYGKGEEVELFLNGRTLGRKPSGEQAGFITYFELAYEPGVLKAVSYENGQEIGYTELQTAEGKEHLMITQEEQYGMSSEGEDLIFVAIRNEAENGVCVTNHEVKLKASAEGAVILGFGSANPKTVYPYQTDETETFCGRALLILQRVSGDKHNPVKIRIIADNAGGTDSFAQII